MYYNSPVIYRSVLFSLNSCVLSDPWLVHSVNPLSLYPLLIRCCCDRMLSKCKFGCTFSWIVRNVDNLLEFFNYLAGLDLGRNLDTWSNRMLSQVQDSRYVLRQSVTNSLRLILAKSFQTYLAGRFYAVGNHYLNLQSWFVCLFV